MTLKPEDIIREAELEIQHRTSDQLEKKAGEVADDMISQRNFTEIEKLASHSPLIKMAMELTEDPFLTKSFKVNHCIEKVAAGATEAAGSFLKSLMNSEAGKRIAIGAGIGAGTGFLAGNKDDRMGSAIKGGILGGAAGGAFHMFKGVTPDSGFSSSAGRRLDNAKSVLAKRRTEMRPTSSRLIQGVRNREASRLGNAISGVQGSTEPMVSKAAKTRVDNVSNALTTSRNSFGVNSRQSANAMGAAEGQIRSAVSALKGGSSTVGESRQLARRIGLAGSRGIFSEALNIDRSRKAFGFIPLPQGRIQNMQRSSILKDTLSTHGDALQTGLRTKITHANNDLSYALEDRAKNFNPTATFNGTRGIGTVSAAKVNKAKSQLVKKPIVPKVNPVAPSSTASPSANPDDIAKRLNLDMPTVTGTRAKSFIPPEVPPPFRGTLKLTS
jgi:hypothetical protein